MFRCVILLNVIFSRFHSILFALMLMPMATQAAVDSNLACLSDFKQAVDKQQVWNIMDPSCPTGEGLWSQIPTQDEGVFFVQCAFINHFPETWLAKLLKKTVSEKQIILKIEDDKFRCLVGPFYRYSKAKNVMASLHQNAALKSAFIRDLSSHYSMPTPVAIPISSTATSIGATSNTAIDKTAQPLDPLPVSHSTKNIVTTISEEKDDLLPASTPGLKRYYFKVAGLLSPKPQLYEPSYITDEYTWWRATLDEANNTCKKNGMTLISTAKLKSLATNEQTKKLLPNRLPFWVAEQGAFDVMTMQSMKLSSGSLLFVLCE